MTRWAASLALTRGLLVGLCVCWPSYTSAEGTERDPSQDQTQTADAVEAIRCAAEQGTPTRSTTSGSCMTMARGVPEDDAEAVRWYCLAADQGGRRGTVHPRVMYAYGKGVSQDDVAAHMWFSLAGCALFRR